MQIIKKITVKQVLTENSKLELTTKFSTEKSEVEKELEQLKFQFKKWEKKYSQSDITRKYENEMKKRTDRLKQLDFLIEQLNMLPIGSEVKEKEVQGLVDINIGSDWVQLLKGHTIVIKDGIVHDIR
jgi:hypothetical protein